MLSAIRLFSIVALGSLLCFCGSGPASCDEPSLRPGWECLPAECMAAIRIPQGSAIAEAFRTQTKLGTMAFSPDRVEKVMAWFSEETGPFRALEQELGKIGLTAADLPQIFAGESGAAFLVSELESEQALPMALLWLEPGQDLAERMMTALEKRLDEESDAEHPVKRVDVELDDHPVMQLTLPVVTTELGEMNFPDDFATMSEEEQDAIVERAMADRKANAKETVKFTTALLSRWEQRIVLLMSLDPQDQGISDTMSERMTATYVRFLQAQHGEPGEFAARHLQNSGIARVWSHPGTPFVEALADPQPFFRLTAQGPMHDEIGKHLATWGIDQLGALGFRWTLDNTRLRSGLFVTAPAPRKGLLTLLDQAPAPEEPPAWVPADVLEYQHLSFDLSLAFQTIKELLVAQIGDAVTTSLGFAETQVKGHVGTDIRGLLASLGNVHTVVRFMPEAKSVTTNTEDTDELGPSERLAVVWQLRDVELWTRVMEVLGELAPLAEIQVKATDEQGFRGWRMDSEATQGGLVTGKGYLVLGQGDGTLERVLASLNTPPTGADALVSSPLYEKARNALASEPAFAFSIADGERLAKMTYSAIETVLNLEDTIALSIHVSGDDTEKSDDVPHFTMDHMRSILPDPEELDGLMGVSVSQTSTIDLGWLSESVLELPQ